MTPIFSLVAMHAIPSSQDETVWYIVVQHFIILVQIVRQLTRIGLVVRVFTALELHLSVLEVVIVDTVDPRQKLVRGAHESNRLVPVVHVVISPFTILRDGARGWRYAVEFPTPILEMVLMDTVHSFYHLRLRALKVYFTVPVVHKVIVLTPGRVKSHGKEDH